MSYQLRSNKSSAIASTLSQKLSRKRHTTVEEKSPSETKTKQKTTKSRVKKEAELKPVKVKKEPSLPEEVTKADPPSPPAVDKVKKERHIKIEYEESMAALPQVDNNIWSPPYWREQLVNIRRMRADFNAPVDSMGCEKISDRDGCPKDFRYQVMLSLMMSSMTKDETTSAALYRLRQHGCSVKNILATSDDVLGKLIYPVGFWKSKVKFIKQTSEILKEKYDSDIPTNAKELMALPGIGPKMAHLIMQCAWDKTTGIAVDTHVFRITQRLGWVERTPKQPEDSRKMLESWLPRELWHEINWLLVGFGQQTCPAISPKCGSCLNNEICLYPNKKIKMKKK